MALLLILIIINEPFFFRINSIVSFLYVFASKKFVLGLIDNVYNEIGFQPETKYTSSTVYNRKNILNYACQYGHQKCIDSAKAEFDKLKTGNYSLVFNIYPIVVIKSSSEDLKIL